MADKDVIGRQTHSQECVLAKLPPVSWKGYDTHVFSGADIWLEDEETQ